MLSPAIYFQTHPPLVREMVARHPELDRHFRFLLKRNSDTDWRKGI